MNARPRQALSWLLATLPLAPVAGFVYFLSEWLFFVTKPSVVAALPVQDQLGVLFQAPWPLIWRLALVQLAVSVVAVVRYPHWRAVAFVPSGAIGGTLLLILLDNFTYTMFGVGMLTAGWAGRAAYAGLWPSLMVFAAWRLQVWLGPTTARVAALAVPLGVLLVVGAPTMKRAVRPVGADLSAPPPGDTHVAGTSSWPNILFLGIDGVDATSMSAYGADRSTTPFLESLKDESLFFENAFSNVGRTHGSLVALLTGRLPFATHVTFPPTILQGEDSRRHLPQMLKGLGYTTLQLGMRHYADADDAHLLGFDAANYRWQRLEDIRAGAGLDEAGAFRSAVADRLDDRLGHLFGFRHAIDGFSHVEGREESPYWRDSRRIDTLVRYLPLASQPWFVHLHLLDTHCCRYHPRRLHFTDLGPEDNARDSQLRETDEQVRQLFDTLKASGQLERTVVVISSDHTNGWTTTGRVPLIIRFPDARFRGSISANVQLADVAPTVLDYLKLPVPEWMDGVSLLDAVPADRPIFGVSEIADRRTVAAYLSAVREAGPPNYGAGSVTLIFGGHWFELDLRDGAHSSGPVLGHPLAGKAPSVAQARRLLAGKTKAAGFVVGGGRAITGAVR